MRNAQPGNYSRLGIDSLLAKLLRSEIVSSKQLNSVLRTELDYIRPSCPQGNITWRKPNITAKQYNSPKANITEKDLIFRQGLFLAEDEGFEPPQTESESGVLPLH